MSAAQNRIRADGPVSVGPLLPLSLLEAVRIHDRPREVLEDEDLAVSMPRRLGLTGVIESQIHRYEEAVRRGRPVPAEEVLDLLRLVLRRPDAEPILREAGLQVARHHFARTPAAATAAVALLPRAARLAATRRSARRMLRRLLGPGRLEMTGRPLVARIHGPLATHVETGEIACVLYAAALEELAFLYTRERRRIVHSRCAVRGEEYCEWTLEA